MDFFVIFSSHNCFLEMPMGLYLLLFCLCCLAVLFQAKSSENCSGISLSFNQCNIMDQAINFLIHGMLQFLQKDQEDVDEELDIRALESGFVSCTLHS